jgi:hypothetical protein
MDPLKPFFRKQAGSGTEEPAGRQGEPAYLLKIDVVQRGPARRKVAGDARVAGDYSRDALADVSTYYGLGLERHAVDQ